MTSRFYLPDKARLNQAGLLFTRDGFTTQDGKKELSFSDLEDIINKHILTERQRRDGADG